MYIFSYTLTWSLPATQEDIFVLEATIHHHPVTLSPLGYEEQDILPHP